MKKSGWDVSCLRSFIVFHSNVSILSFYTVPFFTESDARQQRGHDRLPGQSVSPLPDPGSACSTPRQLVHSRPEVL